MKENDTYLTITLGLLVAYSGHVIVAISGESIRIECSGAVSPLYISPLSPA